MWTNTLPPESQYRTWHARQVVRQCYILRRLESGGKGGKDASGTTHGTELGSQWKDVDGLAMGAIPKRVFVSV